jgi:hypothetical protein
MFHPKDPPCHVPNLDKMIVDPRIKKLVKNIVKMGMDKIVGQMQKTNLEY